MDPKMMASSISGILSLSTEILAAPGGKFKILNILVICRLLIEF